MNTWINIYLQSLYTVYADWINEQWTQQSDLYRFANQHLLNNINNYTNHQPKVYTLAIQ